MSVKRGVVTILLLYAVVLTTGAAAPARAARAGNAPAGLTPAGWHAIQAQVAKLIAADGAWNDRFGTAVSVEGDTAVVGAALADVGGNEDQGVAYVFQRDQGGPGAWGQVAKLVAADGWAGDEFGTSVSVDGETAVVGAHLAYVGGNALQGAAYVFYRDVVGPTLHLFRLKANAAAAARPGWSKVVVLGKVHDQDHAAFAGATAEGTWTYPDGSTAPSVAGPTDAFGRFKFRFKTPLCGLFQFDLTGLSVWGGTYDPDANDGPTHIEVTAPCP